MSGCVEESRRCGGMETGSEAGSEAICFVGSGEMIHSGRSPRLVVTMGIARMPITWNRRQLQ